MKIYGFYRKKLVRGDMDNQEPKWKKNRDSHLPLAFPFSHRSKDTASWARSAANDKYLENDCKGYDKLGS